MPRYREAVYGGETVILENEHLRLEVHKRLTGWGWGELWAKGSNGEADRFVAVLEHLAEADLAGLAHPLRLEAGEYKLSEDATGQTLTFEVQLQEVQPPTRSLAGNAPSKARSP